MESDSRSDAVATERLFPSAILAALRCPLCQQRLDQDPRRLHCAGGHSFDRARDGHVTLGLGHRPVRNADTPAMVAARDRLQGSGLFEPIRRRAAELIGEYAPPDRMGLIADLAGGTGYYLAGVLDRLPASLGICIDLSTAALKRAARCHPRAVAIGADLRAALPVADAAVTVAMSIFGPRPVPEIMRIMAPGAILIVVTPTVRHLSELVGAVGMVTVDRRKDERLATSLTEFDRVRREVVEFEATIDRSLARALVVMGPSAHHVTDEQLESGLDAWGNAAVTVSVTIGLYGLVSAPVRRSNVGADGFEPPTARV